MINWLILRAKEHLTENNMSYYQHLKFAMLFGFLSLLAGCCLIVHAVFPCWFQTSGSDLVQSMAIVFKKRKKIDDT
jgi:Trk-type K+ transport system membrane component